MGYTGDLTQLDDAENGFWYFAGYQGWRPEKITANLGKDWLYNYRMHYKPYPCCALFHGRAGLLLRNRGNTSISRLKRLKKSIFTGGWAWTIRCTETRK